MNYHDNQRAHRISDAEMEDSTQQWVCPNCGRKHDLSASYCVCISYASVEFE